MLDRIYVDPYICGMNLDPDTLFRLLGDLTRLRVVMLLQQAGELCVCELTHALDLSQPKISRHLAHLREGGLLLTRRDGLWMYYRINPDLHGWAQDILQATLAGNAAADPFQDDQRALADMPNRPGAACCA
jgi:ArsR family transcriptional regulator